MFFTESSTKDNKSEKAMFLGKWLWVLFWLFIPSIIASAMVNENIASLFPALLVSGQILQTVCQLIYGAILIKVSNWDSRYRISGIIVIAANILSIALEYIFANNAEVLLIMLIPLGIVGLVGEYNEYMAHSDVVEEFDKDISAKWKKLWKWYIGSFGLLVLSIVLVFITAITGLFVMLASAIAIIVVSILKLVYLYRMAKVFRDYTDSNPDVIQSGFTGSDF